MKHTQSGNVLIIILITIALLGSVTALLTRSGSSTNETGDYERMSIRANEIIAHAKQVEQAVVRLMQHGCSENEISFQYDQDGDGDYNDNDETYAHNPNSPSDLSCHIHHENGGGVSRRLFENPLYTINHNHCIDGAPTPCPNTNLALFLISEVNGTSGINSDLCIAINNIVGVPLVSGVSPSHDFGLNATTGYVGSMVGGINSLNTTFSDYSTGCGLDTAGTYMNRYHFYHFILKR